MSLNEIATIVWKNEVASEKGEAAYDGGPVGLALPNGKIRWLEDEPGDPMIEPTPVWMMRYQAEALARAIGCLFKEV